MSNKPSSLVPRVLGAWVRDVPRPHPKFWVGPGEASTSTGERFTHSDVGRCRSSENTPSSYMFLRRAVERLRSGNRMKQYFPFSPVKVGVDGSFF